MKKMFFLAATTALALSSCSSEDVASENVVDNGLVPVTFDAPYLTSRATTASDKLELDGLKTRGFGVFAYEQGTLDFDQYYPTALTPNFMNNQKVMGYTSVNAEIADVANFNHWGYNPVKYWSNNEGAKASFFAYAPYKTGANNTLKTASSESPRLVLHGRYNGPAIYYKVPETLDKGIDLCWGDYNNTGHAAVDLVKPGYDDKILFNFKHALSRISFNAQLWVNEVRPDKNHAGEGAPNGTEDYVLDANTTITIKSLKLIGNMATEGYLRLSDGKWDAQVSATKTLEMGNYFDGGQDGSGACKYILENNKKEQALFGESTNDAMDNYFMTIPGGSFKVQVEYEVATKDADHPENCHTVTVKQLSDDPISLEAGMSYQIHMNIGMTSTKFTATVSEWSTTDTEEVDLPNNLPMIVNVSEAAKAVKSVESSAPSSAATIGELYLNSGDNKLYKSAGTATPGWAAVAVADCPEYIVYENSGTKTYYKHDTGSVSTYAEITTPTEAASLEAAKTAASQAKANGYYKVGAVVYWIQVKNA